MGKVLLTPEFFRKEMLNYGNARQVLARELFQNSIDAGATKIDINIDSLGLDPYNPTAVRVKFTDNGSGMTRETLEEVFFALGRTTKNTDGTIGGFGKARIVTCFGMDSYTIRTGNLHVSGSGADYEIVDDGGAELPVRGTIFEIVVPLDIFGPTIEEFTRAFCDYLSLCQMNCAVRINGVPWSTWAYRRKLVRRLTFADVHVNKSAPYSLQHRMLIRVGGVLMYEKFIAAEVLIIVEIDPGISRHVLLSNRDRLHYQYENELEKFAQEVAVNTSSALRTSNVIKQVLPGEARRFVPKAERRKFITQPSQEQEVVERPVYSVSSENIPNAQKVSDYRLAASSDALWPIEDEDETDVNYTDPISEGMVFINESDDPRVRKAASLYHPSKWGDGKGARRRKLLSQWVVACEYALEEFCFLTGRDAVNWRWGWYFSDNARAGCEQQRDGSYALILNPIHGPSGDAKDVATMHYAIREFDSHVSLVTLACHEVAHISEGTHDEGYATMFTQLLERTMRHIPTIHREMTHTVPVH